ncbi:hypothetical protein [Dyella jiangningensis]|uniref:hypothetical protein n=1 Tax=Dyella jiangningensis TaxID=1379159 RepID=UPI0011BEE818|nr:hypothetical protein [Dyella jiangningensis]
MSTAIRRFSWIAGFAAGKTKDVEAGLALERCPSHDRGQPVAHDAKKRVPLHLAIVRATQAIFHAELCHGDG